MKKVIFFCFTGFTFYIAGMYRYMPLTVLCVAEALFAVMMIILVRLCRRSVAVTLQKNKMTAVKSNETEIGFLVKNSSALPHGKLKIGMQVTYRGEKPYKGKVSCGADGEIKAVFSFPYCGIAEVAISFVRVYDFISLFSCRKKVRQTAEAAVFPNDRTIRLDLPSYPAETPDSTRTTNIDGDTKEIRQTREYRAGDSVRHVHWNLSAKTDELWIKEYERESDDRVDLVLDARGFGAASLRERSEYYEILSAVVLGLLEAGTPVRVHWHDGEELESAEVDDDARYRNMMLRVYKASLTGLGTVVAAHPLRLDLNGDVYFHNRLVYRRPDKKI